MEIEAQKCAARAEIVPRDQRRKLLEERCRPSSRDGAAEGDFVLSDYLVDGEPCHYCRQIHDALLGAYHGDWLKAAQMMVRAESYTPVVVDKERLLFEAANIYYHKLRQDDQAKQLYDRQQLEQA